MSNNHDNEDYIMDMQVVDLTNQFNNENGPSQLMHTGHHTDSRESSDSNNDQMEIDSTQEGSTGTNAPLTTAANGINPEVQTLDEQDANDGMEGLDVGSPISGSGVQIDSPGATDTPVNQLSEADLPPDMDSDDDANQDTDLEDHTAHSDIDDDVWTSECVNTCRPKWWHVHQKSQYRRSRIRVASILLQQQNLKIQEKHSTITTQRRRIRELEEHVENLERLVDRLRGRKGLRTEVTWPRILRLYLLGEFHELPFGLTTYEEIYKLSCRESNMAPHPDQVLPGLKFIESDIPLQPADQGVVVEQLFSFEDFSLPLQFRILQRLLCFCGEKIHVLSRLDPYHEPSLETGVLGDDPEQPRLLYRFHISNEPVSLTYATMPNELLAPLLVCRKWHFWGSYLFYGENTFAFSSLGE